MEGILAAHEQLEKRGNLAKTIQDVQKTIDLLQAAQTLRFSLWPS
jgi:hypothetical protein